MNLFERLKRPTPRFFRRLRNIGVGMTAIGGAIVTMPLVLPVALTIIAGYLIVGGTVASVVSQMVINDTNEHDDHDDTSNMSGRIIPLDRNPLLDPNL
ncbi:hypothetical protein POV26_03660 [Aequorivita todarodis]|uniref:hypothetical protein n=1 Tax=Aequorivita todarodis TaxID=2036821 RepID=UPI002350561E|nr:hypothetical protein [Aequorivita todarodis]MDC8000120.1 hypothetical protein [Aequorivita todarodis]